MEYELIKKVTEIINVETSNELLEQKFFCDELNPIFKNPDLALIPYNIFSAIDALKKSTSMQPIIPPEIKEGLKKGIYKFNKSDGEFLAQIINTKDGKIVQNLRLEEVQQLANPARLSALSSKMAMQMKLAEIQNLIEGISIQVNRKLDSIIQNQVDAITSKAESCLSKFVDYKYHPKLKVEIKDVKFSLDETIFLLKKDIINRINSIEEIENRKGNWFRDVVQKKDIEDAVNNVSYIREEAGYLQILFRVKFHLTNDYAVISDFSKYLKETFPKEVRFMLTGWEDRPKLVNKAEYVCFWVEVFPQILTKIDNKAQEPIALGGNDE